MREGTIFVRCSLKEPFVSREFRGDGEDCPACGQPVGPEDAAVLVPIGPGADEEAREKAAAGRFFNAVALLLHRACATGSTAPTPEAK